ncbi:MAG: TIGR00266 family protein, partial [Nitrososphaerota archaeon]|nr:TIGR00266 family protein [Nitrososphaerota archaeon]
NEAGVLGLVSAPVGDIARLQVAEDRGHIIQKASYVSSSPTIDLDLKWEGFTKGLFGQGLFMLKVKGRGDLFINTFGAIETRELAQGEKLIVDNFHLVGFSDDCKYEVRKFGGLKSTILGGEGLVTHIEGPGTIYIQTKNPREFADWLWTLIEPKVQSRAR